MATGRHLSNWPGWPQVGGSAPAGSTDRYGVIIFVLINSFKKLNLLLLVSRSLDDAVVVIVT
jgi:hypothetical protein